MAGRSTVLLEMHHGTATVSFVMSEKAWAAPDIHEFLKQIATDAAIAGLGKPIDVRVVDPYLEKHWETRIE